jgi:hypothetical protein
MILTMAPGHPHEIEILQMNVIKNEKGKSSDLLSLSPVTNTTLTTSNIKTRKSVIRIIH